MDVTVDSTNLTPPFLGQAELPAYPAIPHIVRVYAPAIIGANVYPAYIQQWVSPLSLRDREQVYLWEANNILLGPGYYEGRLVGSYAGLPLLVTYCCPTGSFSSSSPSSHGG